MQGEIEVQKIFQAEKNNTGKIPRREKQGIYCRDEMTFRMTVGRL